MQPGFGDGGFGASHLAVDGARLRRIRQVGFQGPVWLVDKI